MVRRFIFAALLTISAHADPRPWQFFWENDIGVLTLGADEYYTNGMRVTVGSKADHPWAPSPHARRYHLFNSLVLSYEPN